MTHGGLEPPTRCLEVIPVSRMNYRQKKVFSPLQNLEFHFYKRTREDKYSFISLIINPSAVFQELIIKLNKHYIHLPFMLYKSFSII